MAVAWRCPVREVPVNLRCLDNSARTMIVISGESAVSQYMFPRPLDYVARDFIAELFQKLCERYLRYCGYPVGEELYSVGRSKASIRRAIRKILLISWLSLRAAVAIAIIIGLSWLFRHNTTSTTTVDLKPISDLGDRFSVLLRHSWDSHWPYFALGILVVAIVLLPGPITWRRYLWRRREPELIRKAREYLLRLRIDKTVTRSTSVTSSGIRGMSLGISRGASAKYTQWTLPELVSYTRRFMYDVSQSINNANRPIVIAIDEIDRIGTLDHAEAFIGDIKTVFGVEKCYFLVAVAEDVGSLFAQRATAGRSILENAFDEIVTVGPLELEEARNLLLRRVPGFTDAFVYLVYALSGGLPRELIRVTRRLIEINLAQADGERYPRLADLTFSLVAEAVIDAIDASRKQMSRLDLPTDWAWYFDNMRSASIALRQYSESSARSSADDLYHVIEGISKLPLAKIEEPESGAGEKAAEDQNSALHIINRLSAFSYFGITVIDAFSDRYFDLDTVKRSAIGRTDGAYEHLAVARIELSLFAASARMILDRFRASVIGRDP